MQRLLVAAAKLLALLVFHLSCSSSDSPRLIESVEAPDGSIYALFAYYPPFADFDPTWYVYQFASHEALSHAKIERGFYKGALLESYEEGGDHAYAETLDLIDGRFLVVSRAGIYHSLYDLTCSRLVVHEMDPFHAANIIGLERRAQARAYLEWKLRTLDQPIREILKDPKVGCAG